MDSMKQIRLNIIAREFYFSDELMKALSKLTAEDLKLFKNALDHLAESNPP